MLQSGVTGDCLVGGNFDECDGLCKTADLGRATPKGSPLLSNSSYSTVEMLDARCDKQQLVASGLLKMDAGRPIRTTASSHFLIVTWLGHGASLQGWKGTRDRHTALKRAANLVDERRRKLRDSGCEKWQGQAKREKPKGKGGGGRNLGNILVANTHFHRPRHLDIFYLRYLTDLPTAKQGLWPYQAFIYLICRNICPSHLELLVSSHFGTGGLTS